jgi:hypothetical protein
LVSTVGMRTDGITSTVDASDLRLRYARRERSALGPVARWARDESLWPNRAGSPMPVLTRRPPPSRPPPGAPPRGDARARNGPSGRECDCIAGPPGLAPWNGPLPSGRSD